MNRIIGFRITGRKWSLIILMFNPILCHNSFYVFFFFFCLPLPSFASLLVSSFFSTLFFFLIIFIFFFFCPPPPRETLGLEFQFFPQTTLSSNHPLIAKTQLIILHANQLRTKTLANLHSRALALMREPHIQTIYLCNVYPFCFSSKIH